MAEYESTNTGTVLLKHREYDAFGNIIDEINRGDFNGDGQFTVDDVNILLDAISTTPDPDDFPWLDLDGDSDIDIDDVHILIREIYGTEMGDTDLDGQVGGSDYTTVATYFGDPGSWGWEHGDFDGTTGGSNEVGGSDFTTLVSNFGFNNGQGGINSLTDYVFGFTGRLLDEVTGLQNNLNRWYDAAVGRWISEDPIGFLAGETNLYGYVGNEPTNWIDPLGLYEFQNLPVSQPPLSQSLTNPDGSENAKALKNWRAYCHHLDDIADRYEEDREREFDEAMEWWYNKGQKAGYNPSWFDGPGLALGGLGAKILKPIVSQTATAVVDIVTDAPGIKTGAKAVAVDVVESGTKKIARKGLIANNPANRYVETWEVLKDGRWRRRYYRITWEDHKIYRDGIRKNWDETFVEADELGLTGQDWLDFVENKGIEFRKNWLDNFKKNRDY